MKLAHTVVKIITLTYFRIYHRSPDFSLFFCNINRQR